MQLLDLISDAHQLGITRNPSTTLMLTQKLLKVSSNGSLIGIIIPLIYRRAEVENKNHLPFPSKERLKSGQLACDFLNFIDDELDTK